MNLAVVGAPAGVTGGISNLQTTGLVTTATLTITVGTVRISVDQRTLHDWNEIDAVRLLGNP